MKIRIAMNVMTIDNPKLDEHVLDSHRLRPKSEVHVLNSHRLHIKLEQ